MNKNYLIPKQQNYIKLHSNKHSSNKKKQHNNNCNSQLPVPSINFDDSLLSQLACNVGNDNSRGYVGIQDVEICIQKANGDRMRVRKKFSYSNGAKGSNKFITDDSGNEIGKVW